VTAEEWRDVTDWEGLYEVSSHGRVRTIAHTVTRSNGRPLTVSAKFVGFTTSEGRRAVRLPDGKQHEVADLVLCAFVGPRPPGAMALHSDDDPQHNHRENLRWGTRSDNAHDAIRNGRHNFARNTACPWGHAFAGTNLLRDSRQRSCRACANAASWACFRRKRFGETITGQDIRAYADRRYAEIIAHAA
jgi:hypothetical protein